MAETIVLGSPVQCSDTSGSLPFLRPRISGVVLNAPADHLEYLIVHRGLLGGQDQSVPAGDIDTATVEGVHLRIALDELKSLPQLDVKLPGQTYHQRAIPEDFVLLGKGTPVMDEGQKQIGHFYGVVVGPERKVERILLDRADHTGIPADSLIECGEGGIQVKTEPAAAAPQTARAPSPGTTVRDPVCDQPVDTATALRAEHRGETYYFCSLSCKHAFELDPATYAAKARTV